MECRNYREGNSSYRIARHDTLIYTLCVIGHVALTYREWRISRYHGRFCEGPRCPLRESIWGQHSHSDVVWIERNARRVSIQRPSNVSMTDKRASQRYAHSPIVTSAWLQVLRGSLGIIDACLCPCVALSSSSGSTFPKLPHFHSPRLYQLASPSTAWSDEAPSPTEAWTTCTFTDQFLTPLFFLCIPLWQVLRSHDTYTNSAQQCGARARDRSCCIHNQPAYRAQGCKQSDQQRPQNRSEGNAFVSWSSLLGHRSCA